MKPSGVFKSLSSALNAFTDCCVGVITGGMNILSVSMKFFGLDNAVSFV